MKDYTTYCDDAIEKLATMRGVADCLVTDPPYKLTSGGPSGMLGGIFDPSVYNNNGSIVECDIDWSDFMLPCYEALKPVAHAYFMANNRNVQAMLNEAEKAGFYFHNLLVLDKISPTANRWYMKNCEFIGFFSKGKAFEINDCGQKQLIKVPQVDETNHPTEKPVPLMRAYIENSTKIGDIVLDPFMGSGTTGVAAIQCGRKFIGIEKNEKFFSVANHRLKKSANSFGQFL